MSSHGGFIGVALGVWGAAKILKFERWALADVIVVPAALGLALGRVGNFINLELYPGYWALVVVAADVGIALLCWYVLTHGTPRGCTMGRVLALFLILYSVVRFGNEFVRIQEWPLILGLTRGQLLTIPVFLLGLYFWVKKAPVA
jgi:phosphatidylglycerol:prolipoprotein diacylglycerol transferase